MPSFWQQTNPSNEDAIVKAQKNSGWPLLTTWRTFRYMQTVLSVFLKFCEHLLCVCVKEREPVLYFDSGQSIFVLGIYWMRILVIVLPIYRVCVSVHTCVCVYVCVCAHACFERVGGGTCMYTNYILWYANCCIKLAMDSYCNTFTMFYYVIL